MTMRPALESSFQALSINTINTARAPCGHPRKNTLLDNQRVHDSWHVYYPNAALKTVAVDLVKS